MKQLDAKRFIADNHEALSILAEKLREIDTVRAGDYSKYPEDSRRLAIEIIEKWMTEIFGIANYEEIKKTKEEESLFIRLKDNSA